MNQDDLINPEAAAEEFFSGGAKAFPFNDIGDTVTGEITQMEKRQQTNLDGVKLFWDNGDPRMQLVVTLATDLHESDNDDGERTIFVKGGRYEVATGRGQSMKDAIADALKSVGLRAPRIGDRLGVSYTGEGPKRKGYNPPKLYTAGYEKAIKQDTSGFFDGERD